MLTAEVDFINALRDYGKTPNEDTRRTLFKRRMAAGALANTAKWPDLFKQAADLTDVISHTPLTSMRTKLLCGVATATAQALAGDIGDHRPPTTPPAPIRQYADE
ncbi:MAG: hypothetical protein AAGJ87_17180 [Pseudomonadota bacterium]